MFSRFIDCSLTNVAALAVLITGQASVSRVVASYHSSVVVDDCVQVVDGRVLHFVFLADTELTQIQIPAGVKRSGMEYDHETGYIALYIYGP